MTIAQRNSYNTVMIAVLGLVLALASGSAATAGAPTYAVGDSPVINITIAGGNVFVRTWNRPDVQVESTGQVDVQQVGAQAVAAFLSPHQINVFSPTVNTARGPVTLPPETFVLSSISASPHQGIAIKGKGGDTIITIPGTTAFLMARMPGRSLTLEGYRNGTFFVQLRGGFVHLLDMGGDGFVQVTQGPILAQDSSFTRLRARTGTGGILFQRCNARQIEVSSIFGGIVYDNGVFEDGLARFESQNGAVAIGVASGNAQLAAHSDVGRVFTNFERRTHVDARAGRTTASLGKGGPVVNVSAGKGVFLYDGAFETKTKIGGAWKQFGGMMQRMHERLAGPSRPAALRQQPQRQQPRAPLPARRAFQPPPLMQHPAGRRPPKRI